MWNDFVQKVGDLAHLCGPCRPHFCRYAEDVRHSNVQFLQSPPSAVVKPITPTLQPLLECVLQADPACQALNPVMPCMCWRAKDSARKYVVIQFHPLDLSTGPEIFSLSWYQVDSRTVSSRVFVWLTGRYKSNRAGRDFLSVYATLHYSSFLLWRIFSPYWLVSLFCVSQFLVPTPTPGPALWSFLTGQVVYLSHVWRPPEPAPLVSLLCLFRLFYKETHPRARKEQETQSR